MKIGFTYAQIKPVAKILSRMGEKWCPKTVKPARWKRIMDGKAAHIEYNELQGIITALGWDTLSNSVKSHPKRKPASKKK